MVRITQSVLSHKLIGLVCLSSVLLFTTVVVTPSLAQEDSSRETQKELEALQKIREHQDRLKQKREAEARQNQAMLPPDVRKALEEFHKNKNDPNYDKNKDPDYEQRQALLYMNNGLINDARLLGVIENDVYQSAQKDYADVNLDIGKTSAKAADTTLESQQRDPDKPYDAGTDSDYIAKVTSPEQVRKMQKAYNDNVNNWLIKNGVLDEPRSDWHNKLDTDFMADPEHVTDKQFKEIADLNNDAYRKRKAARYEALSRMNPEQLKAAGYDDGKIPTDLATAFVDEMEDMANKKAKKISEALNDPKKLEADPKARAKLYKIQAQQQKYIKRKQEAMERIIEQEGLEGPTAPDRPEITEEDRKFTEELAKKRKAQHLEKGKKRVDSGEISEADLKKEADLVEKNVLKSLEQNQIPVEKPMSDLPSQASKRMPDNRAKTQAASALSRHLSDQATKGYTQTLAELAGKDSAKNLDQDLAEASTRGYRDKLAKDAGKDSSVEKDTQRDIAELSKGYSNKQKTETVNRAVEQFKKAYNKNHPDQKPETVEKKAAEFKRGLEKEMLPHIRPDVNIEKETQKSIAEKSQGLSASGRAEMHEDTVRQFKRGAINEEMRKKGVDEESATKNTAKKVDRFSRGLAREMQKLARKSRKTSPSDEAPSEKTAGDVETSGKPAPGEATTKPRESIKGGPRDVAVFSKKAKITPIDNRKTKKSKSNLDEGDAIDAIQAVYSTAKFVGEAGAASLKQKEELQKGNEALKKNKFDEARQHYRKAAEYGVKARQSLGNAIEEGLNGIPVDKLPGLGGNDEVKKAIALGTYTKSAYQTGEKYGESFVSLSKANRYEKAAVEAEEGGEKHLAIKYRRLAANSQIDATEKGIDAIRATPLIGTGYKLGEARVLSNKAEEARQRAKQALERGDIKIAQELYKKSRELEKQKNKNINGALDNIPLLGQTAKKFEGLGEEYARVYKKLDKSAEYKEKAEEMRYRGEFRKAEKYEALAGKAQSEAHKELTKVVESTPVAGTMQHLSKAALAIKYAKREWKLAEQARQRGDLEAEARHRNKALIQEKEAGENFDTFKENAPIELAALLAAAKSAYAPHVLWAVFVVTSTRYIANNTETGQRMEKAITEGFAGIMSKAEDAGNKLQGEKTRDEVANESLSGAEKAWLKKLDNGEVRLLEGMTRDDFINELRASKSGSRKPASMSNLRDLGAYIEVVPKPGTEKPEIFQRSDSSTPSLEPGDREKPQVLAKIPPPGSSSDTETASGAEPSPSKTEKGVPLPSVIGMGLKEAVSVIQTAGLSPVIEVGDETSDPKKVDTISRQGPSAGSKVEKGSEVTLSVYSEAMASGNVPSVIGMELKKAVATIEAAGLTPVIEVGDETSDADKVGTIAWQGPSAGDEVEEGSDVTLSVYTEGVPGREVPNLVGMSLARAKRILDSRDLFLETVREKAAPRRRDENIVYKQYPEPGLEVPNGIGIRAWAYKKYVEHRKEPKKKAKRKTSTGPLAALEFPETIGWVYFNPERAAKLTRSSRGWQLRQPVKGWDIGKAFMRSRKANVHQILWDGPEYNMSIYWQKIKVKVNWAERNDPGTIDCSREIYNFSEEIMGSTSTNVVKRVTSPRIQAAVDFVSPRPFKPWWPGNDAFRKFAQHVFRQLESRTKPCR